MLQQKNYMVQQIESTYSNFVLVENLLKKQGLNIESTWQDFEIEVTINYKNREFQIIVDSEGVDILGSYFLMTEDYKPALEDITVGMNNIISFNTYLRESVYTEMLKDVH